MTLSDSSHSSSVANTTNQQNCCSRLRAEVKHPAFAAEEAILNQVVHGPASFGASGRWTFVAKTLTFGWTTSIMVDGILDYDPMSFYPAYLTNISLIMAVAYFLSSWINTARSTIFSLSGNNKNNSVTFLHKITWALFALAAPAEIVVTIGYWGLEWDGSIDVLGYRNLMVHGGVLLLLLLEGLVINRIPLRLRHYGILVFYLIGYLIWTVVHSVLEIGNPTTPEDDDSLYTVLQWKSNPLSTAKFAAIFMFILAPLAFGTVYGLSLYSFPCGCNGASRRYLSNTTPGDGTDADDVSMTYVEMDDLQRRSKPKNTVAYGVV